MIAVTAKCVRHWHVLRAYYSYHACGQACFVMVHGTLLIDPIVGYGHKKKKCLYIVLSRTVLMYVDPDKVRT
jgi:hypothetical protein